MSAERVVLRVHTWDAECESCGWGRTGWLGAEKAGHLPPLGPDSVTCHGCAKTFTHRADFYGEAYPIHEEAARVA